MKIGLLVYSVCGLLQNTRTCLYEKILYQRFDMNLQNLSNVLNESAYMKYQHVRFKIAYRVFMSSAKFTQGNKKSSLLHIQVHIYIQVNKSMIFVVIFI